MAEKKYKVAVPLKKGNTRATPSRTVKSNTKAEAISKAVNLITNCIAWKGYSRDGDPKIK